MSSAHVPEQPERIHYPYRQGVEVTSRHFTALGSTYAITGLTDAGFSIGTLQAGRRTMWWLLASELPIVVAIVAAAPTLVAVACAAGYLFFASGMLAFAKRRWPTPLELWATYQGELVLLHISSDYTEFHKIQRALLRAMENCRRRPIGHCG